MAGSAPFSERKGGYEDGINLVHNPEQYMNISYEKEPRGGQWNPKNWSLRKRILIGGTLGAAIVLAIILGTFFGVRANRYPDYSRLNYSIQDTFQGSTFFNNFDYFTGYDPTQGFVHYVDQPGSVELNLTYATDSQAILRVDTSETNATTGRKSARISSKQQYDAGLFVFDIAHSPYGCGTWSSVWLVDEAHWPAHGEIDVIESVNQGTSGNQVTLHTASGCSMKGVKRKQAGRTLTTSCVNSTDDNAGCGVAGAPDSYGPAFNAAGGGVYAMELREAGIRAWFFARGAVPADVAAGQAPDPSTWGTALADFPATECDVATHFRNQSIVVNIDLCGTWAGSQAVYSEQDQCPGSCSDFVATNASAFDTAFWGINSFKVYQAS